MIADFELVGGDWLSGFVCRGAPGESIPNGLCLRREVTG